MFEKAGSFNCSTYSSAKYQTQSKSLQSPKCKLVSDQKKRGTRITIALAKKRRGVLTNVQDGIIHVFLRFQLQTRQGLSVDVAKVTVEGKARGPVGAAPHGREGEEVTPALVAATGVL